MEETVTNIFLVRHGQTIWNLQKRWQGNKNSNLTDLGKEQAYMTKNKIDKHIIHHAYVSPLQRAQDTVKIILHDTNIKVNILDDIREINLGPWEGQEQNETSISHPKEFDCFWNSPELFSLKGAETFEELQKRVTKALDHLFSKHKGCNILVVSHWISIKVALAYYLKQPISALPNIKNPKNAELLCLSKIGSSVTVK